MCDLKKTNTCQRYYRSAQSLCCIQLFATPWTAALQGSMSITNSCSLLRFMPLTWWCHPTISSSVVSFSSCLQSFPALGSFPTSRFLASGGQSIGVSALASVLPMNIQDWFPLGLTGWISMQSKWFSTVFFNSTVHWLSTFFIILCPQRCHIMPQICNTKY